jgi:hypothetical protein
LTGSGSKGYASRVTRLELAGIVACGRCGRWSARLRHEGGMLTVHLDASRARELRGAEIADAARSLTDLVLGHLQGLREPPREIVLDVADGALRALLALGDADLIVCTAQEGVALAVRGALPLYATEEALAHGAQRRRVADGGGGSDTLH